MKIDLPMKVTKHCQDRMREFKVSPLALLYWLPQAQPEKPPKNDKKKFQQNDNVTWWRYGTYIFTVAKVYDQRELTDTYLLMSVFDQRMYL